jgi:nitroreductase
LQKSKSIGIIVIIINNNDGENLYLFINSLILNRWSPMAMTGEELADEELMSLFEAARWATSGYNSQPWRFVYAKKTNVLVGGNDNLVCSNNNNKLDDMQAEYPIKSSVSF